MRNIIKTNGTKDSFDDVMKSVFDSIKVIMLSELTPEAMHVALITLRELINQTLDTNNSKVTEG